MIKISYAVCECVLNVTNGNVTITKEDFIKLKKFNKYFKKLLKKYSLKTKKKYLIQRGGFLQILIPALLTSLATVASSLINKY